MDAPERIWFVHVGKSIVPNSERTGPEDVEYVRADLMAELVEALRECHDALRDHAKMYPHMVKGFTHDAEKRAAAALAKIKEATP